MPCHVIVSEKLNNLPSASMFTDFNNVSSINSFNISNVLLMLLLMLIAFTFTTAIIIFENMMNKQISLKSCMKKLFLLVIK